jgi:citrate lyase subunit beta/citryl-CoA lyase
MINKSFGLDADSLIFDLEDSVSAQEKEQARENVTKSICHAKQTGKEVLVRVNTINSYLGIKDILSVVPEAPDALIIPKADERTIITADMVIGAIEENLGWAIYTIKLVPLMETCKAIVNANKILSASKRINGVQFGAEDLTNDMEVNRTKSGDELEYARNILIFEGKALGIDIIDSPYLDIADLEGLADETIRIKRMGMTGKTCIHPGQISVINDEFIPGAGEVAYARKVVEALENSKREGKGACNLDGKMIDNPIAERARKLIKKAEKQGL